MDKSERWAALVFNIHCYSNKFKKHNPGLQGEADMVQILAYPLVAVTFGALFNFCEGQFPHF